MKGKLTFLAMLIAVLFFVSNDAFASRTHMNSLGLTGADALIQYDSTHWNLNPATIGFSPQLLAATWNTTSNQDGGGLVLFRPVENFTLLVSSEMASTAFTDAVGTTPQDYHFFGGLTDYTTAKGPQLLAYNAIAGAQWLTSPAPTGDSANLLGLVPPTLAVLSANVTAAYKINHMIIGGQLGFGYCSNDYDGVDNDGNLEVYEPQVKLGAFIPFSKSMNMDVAVHMHFPFLNIDARDQYRQKQFTYSSMVAYDITAFLRFNWKVTELHNLHFFGKYTAQDHSTRYENTRTGSAENIDFVRLGNSFQFGFSDEMKINQFAMCYLGFDVTLNEILHRFKGDANGIPITIYRMHNYTVEGTIRTGGECVIIGPVQARLGVNHTFVNYDYDNRTIGTDNLNYSSTAFFGLGIKLGSFVFEFNLDKAIFTEAAGANDLASDVTFIYLLPTAKPAASSEE